MSCVFVSSFSLAERVEPEIMIAKPSDTHIMMRGSVTSAALPQHELKKLPNYAHLYNLPPHENQPKEENVSPVSMIQAKKDKKSRWSNQPARKVEVVALDQENWDDVDIAESESPKKSIEKSTEVKEIEDDNWDEEKLPVDIKKETISSFDNIKSPSETSEMKDTWDDDYKLPAADEKTQDPCNQGPKKIDADFLGQQIAVQIEKIRHRQAILVQQHLNTQVLLGNPPISTSPPIIIEKLGPNTVDDMYDVSMPPPVIISADAIISSDISPIDSVILAQAIQITNKARGFESIALAPVTNIKPFVVAPTTPEIIDLDDVAEVRFDSREGIEVSRPTYGILRKKTPNQVKQIKLQSKMEENWDDDDEESEPPQKVDFNTLSSVLKSSELLQAVSEDENWDDEQDEIIKKKEKEDIKNREREAKARKHEEKSRKNIEKSLKSRNGRKSPDNDNWDEENSNQAYQQVDPDILARHMAKVAAKSFKNNQRNTTSGIPNIPRSNKNKPKVDPIDEENWDDDPELEAVSKELIDPEILAKNVALHNSMDLQTKLSISNKIVPLEDTSESFRKEFGNTSKHREKNNVIKALSSLSTSVASIPVTAAVAAYALQKRKLIEQIYEYHPRRESIDVRKHVDSYSYLPEYAVPVDYGRVPQSHPTHYQTSYDYSSYYKALYTLPKEKSYLPVTKKPKKRELITEIPLKKKKTAVEVVKKIRLEVNAEDLSDGEIVDSDEDFGSDLSSVNDDDDVIEIPVKVDLVDLTEEEIAAAVKEETETVDIKKEYGNTELNPPLPTEKIEIPKELIEAEDSPESPVNMEVNQDPEEWHDEPKEINQQEYSPTSPVNMNVNEEYENNKINQNQESEVVKDSLDDKSSQKEIVETLMKYPETTVEVVEAHHVPNPSKESEATTDTNIAKPEAIQECQLDNKIEDSSPSPVNNETEIIKEQCNILTEVSEVESFSVSTHEDKVIDETSNNEANESPDEMNATSPDSPVRALSDEPSKTLLEDSEQIGQEISPSSPVNINCSDNEAKPKQNNSDKTPVSIIITDPVEVQVEKLPEQPIGTLSNTGEPVTKDSLIEETVMKNHETPKIDAQQIEDGIQESSKIDDDASESCSTINDEDILLDDDELEATTLFLSNEQEKVPEAIVTTSVSNEIEEASVEVHVQKETVVINTSSNTANARFNPYILIKKGI